MTIQKTKGTTMNMTNKLLTEAAYQVAARVRVRENVPSDDWLDGFCSAARAAGGGGAADAIAQWNKSIDTFYAVNTWLDTPIMLGEWIKAGGHEE